MTDQEEEISHFIRGKNLWHSFEQENFVSGVKNVILNLVPPRHNNGLKDLFGTLNTPKLNNYNGMKTNRSSNFFTNNSVGHATSGSRELARYPCVARTSPSPH